MNDDWKNALVEKMAAAMRRNKFARIGLLNCFDEDLPLREEALSEARAALEVALPEILERAAAVAEKTKETGSG